MAELQVFHGDVWDALDADPYACLIHGTTWNKPARSGFAATVVHRLGVHAVDAHYDWEPGRICWLTRRIGAAITQREYHKADPALIEEVVARAALQSAPGTVILVPLIGGGLGGLSRAVAQAALARGAAKSDIPVKLYLLGSGS